jgi:hypothetical protein
LNFFISNDRNSADRIMHIEARDNITNLNISSSDLYEDSSQQIISSDKIVINDSTSLFLINLSSTTQSVKVKIEINGEQPGLYRGGFRVTATDQNATIIPVKIDIKPNFYKVVIWVIDGIALSVMAWNLIGYLFLERRFMQTGNKTRNVLTNMSPEEVVNVGPSMEKIVSKLERSKPNAARREYVKLRDSLPNDNIISQIYSKTIQSPLNIRLGQAVDEERIGKVKGDWDNRLQNVMTRKFSLRDYTTKPVILKNVISGLTGVVFGLVVGFIPLLDGGFITNLRDIGQFDILILFGLGIGIGNLNETISKIWERPEEENDSSET